MAQKKLKQTVVLRETVGSIAEAFQPGDKLPDWAWEQVKDKSHLFEPYDRDAAYVRINIPRPADQLRGRDYESGNAVKAPVGSPILEELDDEDAADEANGKDKAPAKDEPEADEVPRRNASKASWRAFAEKAKEDGYPVVLTDDMERGDIIAACEAAEVIEKQD